MEKARMTIKKSADCGKTGPEGPPERGKPGTAGEAGKAGKPGQKERPGMDRETAPLSATVESPPGGVTVRLFRGA